MLSGDVAMVLLDSGQIAHIPVEYLESREPESEKEEEESHPPVPEDPRVEGTSQSSHEVVMMDAPMEDPVEGERTRNWIKSAGYRDLGDLDRYDGRSCMRAKQHIALLEKQYLEAVRKGETTEGLNEKIAFHADILDSSALRF